MNSRALAVCCLIALGYLSAWAKPRYENLGNPTEYTFKASVEKIRAVLQQNINPLIRPLGGGLMDDGIYTLGVYGYYTRRYWTGRLEQDGEVNPPEAGKIGTITAGFTVRFTPKSDQQTLVVVTVDNFEQQVGRRYVRLPHFHKEARRKPVKSDTYFEYFFLRKLGELIGEKDMPPLKGGPD